MSALPAAPAGQPLTGTALVDDLRYVGLATRVVSFLVDAALITVVDVVVGVAAALILSVLHIPHELRTILVAIGAVAFVVGSILYFVIFWSTTGQTPGARVMQIRVVSAGGARVKPRWSALRCIGVVLAALPLFAGFAPILFDSRRRGARAVDRRRQPGKETGDPRGFPATAAGRAAVSTPLIRFG
jgi:uncharacterized RDD family membrane protein YckC